MATSVGDRLRSVRLLAGISARELGRLAHLQQSHASLIESGVVANVRVDTLRELARVLGCSLDWLVNGEGATPTAEDVLAAVAAARAEASGEHTAVDADATGTDGDT
jgi:transcriptional regulator with XRE-family HTH domain